MLNKLIPDIRVTQIFPLAGKHNVIAHATDPANSSRAFRSIYILDKDFDDLLGHLVLQPNIVYLTKYCIENFFLEEDAVIELAVQTQPRKTRESQASKLDFPDFLSNAIQMLTPLFRLFFVVQRLNLGLQNCHSAPERFAIRGKPYTIDPALVALYYDDVKKEAMKTGLFATKRAFADFESHVFPATADPDCNVSGKFLMSLTMHYIKKRIKCANLDRCSITYRLAQNSSLAQLGPLRDAIISYLEQGKATHMAGAT